MSALQDQGASSPESDSAAQSQELRTLFEHPVQVVAGKGGVGRTSVAVALALRSARAGQRTLLLEVDAPDSATRALGARPARDEPREVDNNLWMCRMTPPGALKEYALLILRFRLLYRIVFENDLVKYLLRSIPSLAEMTMLGKAWWHATQEKQPSGRPRFDRVIIDAPATGHALTFLSVARVVADVCPPGIMKDQADKMAQMVESAVMHVVAIPEEMPVNEGLELFSAIPHRLRIQPGVAIMNRRQPPLLEPDEEPVFQRLAHGAPSQIEPYLEAAERRRAREAIEVEHEARFFRGASERGSRQAPGLVLPEIAGASPGLATIEPLMWAIDAAAGTPPRRQDGTPTAAEPLLTTVEPARFAGGAAS